MQNSKPSIELTIRQASLADVVSIQQVKYAVWPSENPPQPNTVIAALETPSHQTLLALAGSELAGFVSCFVTSSAAGNARWEIDLLAVHPHFRRKGVASELLKTAVSSLPPEATLSRGLIEVSNIGSQRSFARHGFQTDGVGYNLYISATTPYASATCPPETHLVPVNTLNYRGIWIEGVLSAEALAAGQAERLRQKVDVVGILIREDDIENNEQAQQSQFESVGRYQWWELRLS